MNIIRSLADLDSLVAEHAMGWVWQSNITHGYTILLPPLERKAPGDEPGAGSVQQGDEANSG